MDWFIDYNSQEAEQATGRLIDEVYRISTLLIHFLFKLWTGQKVFVIGFPQLFLLLSYYVLLSQCSVCAKQKKKIPTCLSPLVS